MVNQLFCYMSDYLPEELQGITQNSQQQDVYDNHQDKINYDEKPQFKEQHKIGKRKYTPRIKRPFNDSVLIKKPIKPLNLQQQEKPGRGRKEYAWEEKKKLVSDVQQRILGGQRINDACKRSGISDRSYQRWKRRIQQGQIQEVECQSNQVIIEHSHI